jgi:hypothetical protein
MNGGKIKEIIRKHRQISNTIKMTFELPGKNHYSLQKLSTGAICRIKKFPKIHPVAELFSHNLQGLNQE